MDSNSLFQKNYLFRYLTKNNWYGLLIVTMHIYCMLGVLIFLPQMYFILRKQAALKSDSLNGTVAFYILIIFQ